MHLCSGLEEYQTKYILKVEMAWLKRWKVEDERGHARSCRTCHEWSANAHRRNVKNSSQLQAREGAVMCQWVEAGGGGSGDQHSERRWSQMVSKRVEEYSEVTKGR